MSAIIGVPTTRISNLFISQQLMRQIQYDQRELFRIERQLSTGRRIGLPSEDPDAAMRIIGAQRVVEQKEQIGRNLQTGQSYLTATDVALSGIAETLADVRAAALGAIDTTLTDEQREVAANQVDAAIASLINAGNKQFRGRYLFAGAVGLVQPFARVGETGVEYSGGERRLVSFSDVDTPFNINVPGSEVFGALSEPVLGTADFDPTVTFNTRLDDLRGGLGLSRGRIAVSADGVTSTVDLGGAETLGDVALLLRSNPPQGTALDVEITPTGLKIELDAAPGTLLRIEDVGGGTTAAELGILEESGVVGPVESDDLDPILRRTTPLADALGTRAYTVVRFDGEDNDLIFEAGEVGDQYNNVKIVFVDDGSVIQAGVDEQATYDPATQTLTVTIKEGSTLAEHVVQAVSTAFDAGTVPLTARLDPLDDRFGGSGWVLANAPGEFYGPTAGGSGTPLDLLSGLQIENGGQTYLIDFDGAETVEDLLNALNGAGAGLLAEINATATGINLRSRVSGTDFAIGENGGTTASQLGIRSFTRDTRLENLNYGRGVDAADGTDFTITLADGTVPPIEIDVSGVQTIGELLGLINAQSPGNLEARLATVGNGIELEDYTAGTGVLTVTRTTSSRAAIDLGLVTPGATEQAAGSSPPGLPDVLRGTDVNPLEVDGIFTALARLSTALREGDLGEAERAVEMLDRGSLSLSFARAELGVRQQNLDVMQTRLEEEQVNLRETISLDLDADLVEVISSYRARQTALEASLTASANMLRLSLLNYL